MKLTILGSGTADPSGKRGNPGYLLEIGDEKILLDGGAGSIRKLSLLNVSIWDINKIFYSHLHIDHTLDLIPLLFTYKYPGYPHPRKHKLEIFANQGFNDYYMSLQNVFGQYISSEKIEVTFNPIDDNRIELGTFTVMSSPVLHSPHSIAYRFEAPDGTSFVYSGDTDYCKELSSLANNCSALLVECSFPDDKNIDGHMTPKKVSKLMMEAQPKSVILTHIFPVNDDGTLIERLDNSLDIPVKVAEDLMEFVIV